MRVCRVYASGAGGVVLGLPMHILSRLTPLTLGVYIPSVLPCVPRSTCLVLITSIRAALYEGLPRTHDEALQLTAGEQAATDSEAGAGATEEVVEESLQSRLEALLLQERPEPDVVRAALNEFEAVPEPAVELTVAARTLKTELGAAARGGAEAEECGE